MLKSLREKTVLVLAVAGASIIGGVSTAAVMAAAPAPDEDITACYDSSANGALRVDENNTGCAAGETALQWGQDHTAYGFSVWDPVAITNTLDLSRSKNIENYVDLPGGEGICIQTKYPAHIIRAIEFTELKLDTGWEGPQGSKCDAVPGSNIYVPAMNVSFSFIVH